ncbi:N-acetyltransferase [Pilimelia terevasa]|uniref:N-acetyltransferase n=1 Tax=Pilimelia terevasa TaxID=53372 RepID=A0A8J3BMQ9_9ACTN|nr:GNAT family N-acetyltransferase [Pilimelia terevasa]GGK25668.1 N-acetyltransferase [Pilimelia terevasa]
MDITVTEQPDQHRFVARAGADEVGVLDYQLRGEVLALTHTGVDPARRGDGIATTLVTRALDEIRASGRRVVPVCPFVGHVLARHPEYADLAVGDAG